MTHRQGVADGHDLTLVRAAQQGDADAFAQLVSQHRPWLVSLCRNLLSGDHHAAEDIAQECLVRLHSTLVHCPERDLAVRPWLSVVARHACIDHFRRAQRGPIPVESLPENTANDEDIFEVDPALAKAWGRLKPRHREALYHRELIGLSYDDIATLLQTTTAGVESLLVRARGALRREYRRAGGSLLGCGAFLSLERSVRGESLLPEAVSHVTRCRSCAQVLNEIERIAALLRGAPLPPLPPPRTPWSLLHDGATRLGELFTPLAPVAPELSHLAVVAVAALTIVTPAATAGPATHPQVPPTTSHGVPQVAPLPSLSVSSLAAGTEPLPSPAAAPRPSWFQRSTSFPRPPWTPQQYNGTPSPWYSPAPLTALSPQPRRSDGPPPTWNPWPSPSPRDYQPQGEPTPSP